MARRGPKLKLPHQKVHKLCFSLHRPELSRLDELARQQNLKRSSALSYLIREALVETPTEEKGETP